MHVPWCGPGRWCSLPPPRSCWLFSPLVPDTYTLWAEHSEAIPFTCYLFVISLPLDRPPVYHLWCPLPSKAKTGYPEQQRGPRSHRTPT